MSWSKYADFLAFAVALVLVPGPDFAVVTKNTRRALDVTTGTMLLGFSARLAAEHV
jgi:threonine/homoserine/homoserine lactone efflux protein